VREVATAAGLRSSQTAHHHLRKLEEGYVVREAGRAKMIWPTDRGWEAAGRVALMGRIAAGRGLEAVAVDEAYSLLAELLAARSGRRRYLLLRVVGQSMVGARIEDGDLLVVEEDEAPLDGPAGRGRDRGPPRKRRRGDTKAALQGRRGTVRLRPENGYHEELVLPAEDVRVQGRVVYVVHPPEKKAAGGGA
jgi:repressor LexA